MKEDQDKETGKTRKHEKNYKSERQTQKQGKIREIGMGTTVSIHQHSAHCLNSVSIRYNQPARNTTNTVLYFYRLDTSIFKDKVCCDVNSAQA